VRAEILTLMTCGVIAFNVALAVAQGGSAPADSVDPVKVVVARLELEKYKVTIKGLTQFGDLGLKK
jgi:hypothetical protein